MHRGRGVALLVGLAACLGALLIAGPAAAATPNILIIVTDDQRGGLVAMPATRRLFKHQGVQYAGGYVTTPVCCPSRASIMTGRYSHNTGVKANKGIPSLGIAGPRGLEANTTIQRYLDNAGYTTALVGKYLNSWDISRRPPFFDSYSMVHTRDYLHNTVSAGQAGEDPTVTEVSGYNTAIVRRRALRFLRRHPNPEQPFLLYVAPYAPHAPHTPQTLYANDTFGRWEGNPAVFETDRSDKPPYVRQRNIDITIGRRVRTQQFRTLESVDDMVEAIFEQLQRTGQDANTLAFFISDNGYMWGEHGLGGKDVPYFPSVKVPILARWPGGPLTPGSSDTRGAANIDIAPTIVDAVDLAIPPSQPPMDGRSLLTPWERDRRLTEHWCNIRRCLFWAALQTPEYHYIENYNGPNFDSATVTFREYYDLLTDPFELRNLLHDGNPANDPNVAAIADQLATDRNCAGQACP